jgi:hypothetical protein
MVLLPDESIVQDGKILHFSLSKFTRDIVDGDCCFICGAERGSKPFNDEHVIPQWILKRYDLYNRQIVLPNGASLKYHQNTVPCCQECNSNLGEAFEVPMSKATSGGLATFNEFLRNGGHWTCFLWLNLLFFKQHYKDRLLREELDRRNQDSRSIAETRYEAHHFHHIHSVIRSGYTGSVLNKELMGSLFVLPAYDQNPCIQLFDYKDYYLSQSAMVRLGDVAIMGVLCDSCCVMSAAGEEVIRKVQGPLSDMQLREILAFISYADILLENRPQYFTQYIESKCHLLAELPESVSFSKYEPEHYGHLLSAALDEFEKIVSPELWENVRSGRWTFLKNADGSFNDAHMKLAPPQ